MAKLSKAKREAMRFGTPERLADLAFTGSWRAPDWCNSLMDDPRFNQDLVGTRENILEILSHAPVIVADNVSEFLYADNAKEVWEYTKEFPCCAPPFPEFIVEFRRPSRIQSGGKVVPTANMPDQWAWIFKSRTIAEVERELSDPDRTESLMRELAERLDELYKLVDKDAIADAVKAGNTASLGAFEQSFLVLGYQYRVMERGEVASEFSGMDGWILEGVLLVAAGGLVSCPATSRLAVSADGTIRAQPVFGTIGDKGLSPKMLQDCRDTWSSLMLPATLTLSFLNCKNVTIEQREPDRDINRERKKHGRRPFVRYHTINIEPMRRVLRTEGQSDTQGLKRALHICRGHFSTYTPERPLFGRVSGTFWVPAHVRGSSKEGVVVSDYAVNPPNDH